MTQWLGAALVVLGGAWLGQWAAAELRHRVWALEETARGLARLEGELELSQAPLPQLLERLIPESRGPAKALFRGGREALERLAEEPFAQAWARLAEEQTELDGQARRCLAALGDCLGRWDSQEQRQAIAAACRQIEELAVRAEEERQRQSRVYRALGLSGGAFLVILLL